MQLLITTLMLMLMNMLITKLILTDADNDNHTDVDADENAYITKLILARLLQLEARNNDRAAAAALQCIDTLTQWHSTLI